MAIIAIIFGILLIVVFVSAAYGIFQNLGPYLPLWALILVVALLGIGLVSLFGSKHP
jgi:beta-lactamase regulating signal transducer with metallopeptidase domain